MAKEVLNLAPPDIIKDAAARLIRQREMVGRRIAVPELNLEKHLGKVVVVYTWSVSRPSTINAAKHWAEAKDVEFVAINIDGDSSSAAAAADIMGVVGDRLYETKGLYGPLAEALCFTSRTSAYVITPDGSLYDVLGYEAMPEKIRAAALAKNGGSK